MGCQRAGRYSEHLARPGELLIGGGWERSRVVLPQPLMRTPRIRLKVGNARGLVVTFRTAVCALRNTTPRRASAAGTVKVAENEPLRDGMTLATIAPLATVPQLAEARMITARTGDVRGCTTTPLNVTRPLYTRGAHVKSRRANFKGRLVLRASFATNRARFVNRSAAGGNEVAALNVRSALTIGVATTFPFQSEMILTLEPTAPCGAVPSRRVLCPAGNTSVSTRALGSQDVGAR